MASSVRFMGLAMIAFALPGPAQAQTNAPTTKQSTIRASAKHRHSVEKPKQEEGRQITVQKSTPPWLTLGTDASVSSGAGYVLDTFNQPSPAQGTFMGYRGRERVVNQYGVPGATLFRF
jgi:hypothetical protein